MWCCLDSVALYTLTSCSLPSFLYPFPSPSGDQFFCLNQDNQDYPSSVTFRFILLIKSSQETQYQLIQVFVVKISWFGHFGEFLFRNNWAIAYGIRTLEFRNDKAFRRVTEEGYSGYLVHSLPGCKKKPVRCLWWLLLIMCKYYQRSY
jgi:hypothetical protein